MSSILASLQNHWKSAKTLTASAVNATKQALCNGLDLAIQALDWVAVQGARLILFVPLVLWRGLAVILLVLATVAPITLPILVLGALAASPEYLEGLKESAGIPLQATAVILALGILGNLFMRVLDEGWVELKSSFYRAGKALRNGPWKPRWEIGESVRITRECVLAKIPPNLKCSVKSSWKLMGLGAVGLLLVSMAYPPASPPPVSPPPKHHVVVANVAEANREVTTEVVKVYMRAGAVFSLAHAENAEPMTGAGICLNEYQQRWLDMYRAAIIECLEQERRQDFKRERPPVFAVTAFASIAPATSEGDIGADTSAMTNCEIANRRAEAVGAFLEGKDEKKWQCDGVAEGFRSTDDFCKGAAIKPEERLYEDGDLRFKILVNQWDDPKSMKEHKPVDDGEIPEDRRYRVEMFNRSVYIAVEEDFCRTRALAGGHPP